MSTVRKQPPKGNALAVFLFILALALVGGGYYLYITYGQGVEHAEGTEARQISIQKKDWKKIIFEDPTFQTLQSPLLEPFTVGEKGNLSPFLE